MIQNPLGFSGTVSGHKVMCGNLGLNLRQAASPLGSLLPVHEMRALDGMRKTPCLHAVPASPLETTPGEWGQY